MKKVLLFFICLIVIFIVLFKDEEKTKEIPAMPENKEVRGVFISYIDYGILKNKTKEEKEKIITEMVNNVSYFGLNSIILQVRPFSDAIYPSKIYKCSKVVCQTEDDELNLDILDYFIKKSKEKEIDIYAWINPYRIRNENDIRDISKDSYYYKWFDTDNIERSDNGIFLNPAKEEVLNYITMGIEELCENYDIKGVLFDDYFYPSETIDLKNYDKSSEISLKDYRINNINNLLKRSYETVKSVNKEILFGISPAGNIENNLNKEYLDVEGVLNSDYLDFIIPQLYFGFNNSVKPYIKTLSDWSYLNKKNKDLYVALALYKSGKVDTYAGDGENEWLKESDIIKKQVLVSRNENNYKGFYIFRYEYLFKIFENDNLTNEVKNLKDLIDN